MSIQRFPLDAVQKIRQHIQSALCLPGVENLPGSWHQSPHEDLPEPGSLSELGNLFDFGGGMEPDINRSPDWSEWFISTCNPGTALLKLPGLTLKPKLRLVGYLYREAEGGIGVVWAVPEALSTTAHLEQALAPLSHRTPQADQVWTHQPQPSGALPDVMDGVGGDRSPASFLVASILRRELREFGALGKFQAWSHHRLVGNLPTQAKWQWQVQPAPQDFAPKLRMFPDGKVAVEFFTCRVAAPVTIFQHIDQYPADSYRAIAVDRSVALVQRSQVGGLK